MLILLDIDGVMETTPSYKKVEFLHDQFPSFNAKAADNLQKIISETNASVVLTTSHKSRFSIPEWKNIFRLRGVVVNSISRLDANENHLSRKDEILSWLQNGITESFVIIDDDKSLNDLPAHIKQKCVITSPYLGLNDEAAFSALSILNNQKVAIA